jgi:Skp family chaperone for outer membrane proteins
MMVQRSTRDHNSSNSYQGGTVRTFTIVAMAFLFVGVGIQRVAQADEVKAKMEEMTGEAKAKAQEAKGEVKALTEEAKGNKVKGAVERAKGKTKAAGERIKGEAKELKAKTE